MSEEKLPKGWKWCSFTDVFNISGGTQPPKSTFIYEPKEGFIRLLQIRDFGEKPVPTFIPRKKTLKTCKEEDILIARYGASIGRILTGMKGAYNVAIAKVIIPENINNKYVFWLLKSSLFQSKVTSFQRTAQNGFNKNDLEDIYLPIAPLPEQQCIVAKLDAVFGHLDSLREKLDRIPELLKNFRQQVLTQAVTGELTREWREGKDLGEWEEKSSNDLFEFVTSGSRGWAEYYSPFGNQLFVRITNMNFGRIDLDLRPEKCQYLELPEKQEGKRTLIKQRDILISITADVGMIALIEEELEMEAYVNQHICLARPVNEIDEKFLAYYLMSEEGFGQFQSKKRGATKAGLTLGDIRALKIQVPPHEEQAKIVETINSFLTISDKIESQYQSLKAKINQLPQAVLAKAFRGELVGQEVKEYVREVEELGMVADEKGYLK